MPRYLIERSFPDGLSIPMNDDGRKAVADHLVLLRRGEIVAAGLPHEVLTAEALTETYGIRVDVLLDERTGRVHTRPVGRHTDRPPVRVRECPIS